MKYRILLGISRYDYGRPEWGDSFEYVNFVGPLERSGHEVRIFDTMDLATRGAPEVAGRALVKAVREFGPDLLLCVLSTDELPLEAIREAGRYTVTANWFPDDAWRFNWYSKHVASAFSWALTTSRTAEAKYQKTGVRAIFLPWAYNASVFRPGAAEKKHDVSFVGQRHGTRGRLIDRLRGDGFDVYARGAGWPGGRVGWTDMAKIFAGSRVNLSLIESSAGPLLRRGWRFRGATRADRLLVGVFPPPAQMKARIFEIAGCGGFTITGSFPELGECFAPGKEIVVAEGYKELAAKVRYYLEHTDERESIADAALQRSITNHTYEQRFTQLFERLQLHSRSEQQT